MKTGDHHTFRRTAPRTSAARRLPRADLKAAEDWFRRQGLPCFVDVVDERVRNLLRRRRLWLLLVAVLTIAVFANRAFHQPTEP